MVQISANNLLEMFTSYNKIVLPVNSFDYLLITSLQNYIADSEFMVKYSDKISIFRSMFRVQTLSKGTLKCNLCSLTLIMLGKLLLR